jgi:hypothetical protein
LNRLRVSGANISTMSSFRDATPCSKPHCVKASSGVRFGSIP